ncbi:MAG TPA: hypothetical protein VM223_06475 [Planctomycetota bacterium]|nr:hypothetical protein [Planctomycetota bacterium]
MIGWIRSLFRRRTPAQVQPRLFEPVPMTLLGVGRFIVRVHDIDSHYVYATICAHVDVPLPPGDASTALPMPGEEWWLTRDLCVFDPLPGINPVGPWPQPPDSWPAEQREPERRPALGKRPQSGRTRGFSNNRTTSPTGRH